MNISSPDEGTQSKCKTIIQNNANMMMMRMMVAMAEGRKKNSNFGSHRPSERSYRGQVSVRRFVVVCWRSLRLLRRSLCRCRHDQDVCVGERPLGKVTKRGIIDSWFFFLCDSRFFRVMSLNLPPSRVRNDPSSRRRDCPSACNFGRLRSTAELSRFNVGVAHLMEVCPTRRRCDGNFVSGCAGWLWRSCFAKRIECKMFGQEN